MSEVAGSIPAESTSLRAFFSIRGHRPRTRIDPALRSRSSGRYPTLHAPLVITGLPAFEDNDAVELAKNNQMEAINLRR